MARCSFVGLEEFDEGEEQPKGYFERYEKMKSQRLVLYYPAAERQHIPLQLVPKVTSSYKIVVQAQPRLYRVWKLSVHPSAFQNYRQI